MSKRSNLTVIGLSGTEASLAALLMPVFTLPLLVKTVALCMPLP